jgi:hypothetical protein
MFNARGLPLQYNRQSIGQRYTETEFQSLRAHGIFHTISFVAKPETARVRLLVCDTRKGMIGSVDLPYPLPVLSPSSVKPEKGADVAANATWQSSPTPKDSRHVIKIHGNEGRIGILEWNAERIIYSGDMQPEASAKALLDSLWAKS